VGHLAENRIAAGGRCGKSCKLVLRATLRVLQRLLRFQSKLFELHDANLTQRRKGAKMGNFNRRLPRRSEPKSQYPLDSSIPACFIEIK
jgi:hypothetical protein